LEPYPRIYVEYGPLSGELLLGDSGDFIEGCPSNEALAGVGDHNGDGYDDLLVGDYLDASGGTWSGAAYVYHGPVLGVTDYLSGSGAAIVGDKWDQVGIAVAGAQDTNLDGYDDVLVTIGGSETADSTGVCLFLGPLDGVSSVWDADVVMVRPYGHDQKIFSVAGPGDLDGDSWPDIVAGAPSENGGGYNTGGVWVVFGPVSGTIELANEAISMAGEVYDQAGTYLDALGDLDGDGLPEFAAFAYADTREDLCVSYVVPGSLWTDE